MTLPPVDINIPVFCYHPKMEPAGMCRQSGRNWTSVIDRATNQLQLDAVIRHSFKAGDCHTTPVSRGMVVNTESKQVATPARTSLIPDLHPQISGRDKGVSAAAEPDHEVWQRPEQLLSLITASAKHFPLGDFIMLDREHRIRADAACA